MSESNYLFQMGNDQMIHQYKYLKLKETTLHEDIKFNKICLSKNITPNYVQLQTKCKSIAAQKTLETAKKIWVKEEINSLYTKLNDVNNKKEKIFKSISSKYHSETIEEITNYVQNWIEPILKMKKEKHSKKLKILIQTQTQLMQIETNEQPHIFYPTVENLTNIEFNDKELSILDKSLKYNINLDHKKSVLKDELINIDVAIKTTDKKVQEPLRYNFIHELDKIHLETRKPITTKAANQDMNLIKSIVTKLKNDKAILVKADKGNTTVIINQEEYDKKVEEFIHNNAFKILKKDPTLEFSKSTNNTISKCNSIPKHEQFKLKMIHPKAPTLRGQPKTHKPNSPIRPIVNFRNSPTYKVCKYLNYKIKNSIHWDNKFNIINTNNLVDQIKDITIPNNSIFLSFDIKDMYSNIPPNETLQILQENLTESKILNTAEIRNIIKLTKTTLDQNYFEYNKVFYKQEHGLAMGSPLSGLLADIFMHNFETKHVLNDSNPYKSKIHYWYRYVDDILCMFTGSEQEGEELLQYLNSIHNKIQFTKESQIEKINFLDLTIAQNNGKHTFEIYRKQTQSDLLIPIQSNHPWQHKMAGFHSMINRLMNIPMSEINYKKEVNIIKHLANKNGYSHKMIDKMIKKIKHKKQHPSRTENKENTQNTKHISIPYNTIINKAIRKTFDKTNFKLGYKTRNNTFKIINKLSNNKIYQTNDYNQSGIYKIKCSDCNSFYIGQTGRTFRSRFREHIQALRTNNTTTMKSNFAEHLLTSDHTYKNIEENMEILEYGTKGEKLNSKEDLQIYINYKNNPQNLLNVQNHIQNPIYEKIMNLK